MTSLELLEHEFFASLECRTCLLGGESVPASHIAVVRETCLDGGRLPGYQGGREFLVCKAHAAALLHSRIGIASGCSGCGHEVTGLAWDHVIERVEPIGLPR